MNIISIIATVIIVSISFLIIFTLVLKLTNTMTLRQLWNYSRYNEKLSQLVFFLGNRYNAYNLHDSCKELEGISQIEQQPCIANYAGVILTFDKTTFDTIIDQVSIFMRKNGMRINEKNLPFAIELLSFSAHFMSWNETFLPTFISRFESLHKPEDIEKLNESEKEEYEKYKKVYEEKTKEVKQYSANSLQATLTILYALSQKDPKKMESLMFHITTNIAEYHAGTNKGAEVDIVEVVESIRREFEGIEDNKEKMKEKLKEFDIHPSFIYNLFFLPHISEQEYKNAAQKRASHEAIDTVATKWKQHNAKKFFKRK